MNGRMIGKVGLKGRGIVVKSRFEGWKIVGRVGLMG